MAGPLTPLLPLVPSAVESVWLWLGLGAASAATAVVIAENMKEANDAAGPVETGISYTDVCSSCPPPPECEKKAGEIEKTRNELKKRDSELYEDQHNLFERHYSESNPHPDYGSWEGHIRQFQQKQQRIRRLLSEYETMGCPKNNIPGDAYRWGTHQPYLPKFKG